MQELVGRKATDADLEAVPEHLVAEIIDGRFETHPRPVPRDATAHFALGAELSGPYPKGRDGPGGWVFLIGPELHLGPQVVVPDLAGWRRERLPKLPRTAYIEAPPDWVCELLSPATENRGRGSKLRIYGAFGIGHTWLLDATAQRLEVFELKSGKWQLFETFVDNAEVRAPPFDAIAFSLGLLWPLDVEPDKT